MLNIPPPVWSFAYVLIAAAFSYLTGWPRIPGLPLVALAVLLVIAGISLSAAGAVLFRREGTEINPVSAPNRKLVTSGPYRFTRNPMYLGLVLITLGIAFWVGAWPVSRADRDLCHGKLGAHSFRGGENAPPVRRRIRRLCEPHPAMDLRLPAAPCSLRNRPA